MDVGVILQLLGVILASISATTKIYEALDDSKFKDIAKDVVQAYVGTMNHVAQVPKSTFATLRIAFLNTLPAVSVIFTSTLLIDTIAQWREEIRNESESEKSKQLKQRDDLTIVGLMIGHKANRDTIAYILLLGTAAVHIILSILGVVQFNLNLLALLSFFFIALFLNQEALRYRIKKGFYGTSEDEARDIIEYMLNPLPSN